MVTHNRTQNRTHAARTNENRNLVKLGLGLTGYCGYRNYRGYRNYHGYNTYRGSRNYRASRNYHSYHNYHGYRNYRRYSRYNRYTHNRTITWNTTATRYRQQDKRTRQQLTDSSSTRPQLVHSLLSSRAQLVNSSTTRPLLPSSSARQQLVKNTSKRAKRSKNGVIEGNKKRTEHQQQDKRERDQNLSAN